jgi:hypothetical protein
MSSLSSLSGPVSCHVFKVPGGVTVVLLGDVHTGRSYLCGSCQPPKCQDLPQLISSLERKCAEASDGRLLVLAELYYSNGNLDMDRGYLKTYRNRSADMLASLAAHPRQRFYRPPPSAKAGDDQPRSRFMCCDIRTEYHIAPLMATAIELMEMSDAAGGVSAGSREVMQRLSTGEAVTECLWSFLQSHTFDVDFGKVMGDVYPVLMNSLGLGGTGTRHIVCRALEDLPDANVRQSIVEQLFAKPLASLRWQDYDMVCRHVAAAHAESPSLTALQRVAAGGGRCLAHACALLMDVYVMCNLLRFSQSAAGYCVVCAGDLHIQTYKRFLTSALRLRPHFSASVQHREGGSILRRCIPLR